MARSDLILLDWPEPPALPLSSPIAALDCDGLGLMWVEGTALHVDLINVDLGPEARSLKFDRAVG